MFLKMSVEDAAKIVISGGMVMPNFRPTRRRCPSKASPRAHSRRPPSHNRANAIEAGRATGSEVQELNCVLLASVTPGFVIPATSGADTCKFQLLLPP